MREILFRGKRCDNGEWVDGFLLKECNYATCSWNLAIEYKTDRFGKFAYDVAEVATETVGQFTGLTDKNGKKIFEGDILLFGTRKLVVWWNDEAFQWQAKERQTYPCITFDGKQTIDVVWDNIDLGWIAAEVPCVGKMTTEIIGNIHDNPEFLENP